MTLTPEERTLRARLAAQTRWANEDPQPTALRAQAGLRARFLREVDPDSVLPEAERQRRAESLRRAYYTRLSFEAVRARRARRASPDNKGGAAA